MKRAAVGLILVCVVLSVPQSASAQILPLLYTNNNFKSIPHERPISFSSDGNGGFYGFTETNRPFFQRNITNALDVRLHKFEIDAAYFYISDRGIINADDDTVALSIYLSRA